MTQAGKGARDKTGGLAARLLSAYGMLAVLLLLCAYFSVATYREEAPTGRPAAQALAGDLRGAEAGKRLVIVTSAAGGDDAEFAAGLRQALTGEGVAVAGELVGDPPAVRAELEKLAGAGGVDVVATTQRCRDWPLWDSLRRDVPALARLEVRAPASGRRSAFLSPGNLRNVADQIAVIAVIAIGMTLVIITGGIDLSVGSLLALSAVATAWLVRAWGGESASAGAMVLAGLAATLLCGVVGGFSGLVITVFRIPPFIATLAMMQVASGLAFIVATGQTIYDVPASFTWLGRGTLLSLPIAVVLMGALYLLAHVLMTRTTLGRHLYAVGGNAEAARLSGVAVNRTVAFVYVLSGIMAGAGGVITASQLRAGAATYGMGYELFVIAAVVVGGTSLSGGEGRVFGTLVGAFIIAVIRNGMNLMNIAPYPQKVVLGMVILGAVMLDMLKRRGAARR